MPFDNRVVHEVAVIGLPDPKWIEAVSAVIVCREGHRVEEKELIAHVRDRLAYYKVPKRIIFVDTLPRKCVGKDPEARTPPHPRRLGGRFRNRRAARALKNYKTRT